MLNVLPLSERCWYHAFSDDGSACLERGTYGWLTADNAVVRTMRWCPRHRHLSDTPAALAGGSTDAPAQTEQL